MLWQQPKIEDEAGTKSRLNRVKLWSFAMFVYHLETRIPIRTQNNVRLVNNPLDKTGVQV